MFIAILIIVLILSNITTMLVNIITIKKLMKSQQEQSAKPGAA